MHLSPEGALFLSPGQRAGKRTRTRRTRHHSGSHMLRFRSLAALALLLSPSAASGGLYYSAEQFAELPSRPAGFLVDHRALRAAGYERPDGLPSPLRGDYRAAAERL